jgi:hypothetical protein
MRQAIRLAFAMQRLELRLLLAAVLLVSVAALGIAWQTRVLREAQLACLESAPPAVEGSVESPCPGQDEPLATLDRVSAFAKMGVIFTPIVLGLFLGVPLVAREIESRTAPLAWSLSRSRRRWLLQRAVPVFGVIALACIAVGVAGDVLAHAPPWVEGSDPGFEDWWARGPQVAVRGVAIAAAGMAIGAIVGRQLPALLLGGVATLALFVAVTLVDDALMRSAVEPIAVGPNQLVTGKIYGSGFRQDASGRLLSDEEGYALFGDQLDESGYPPPGYSMVYYLVPSRRYGEFAVYDAAMFGTVAAAGMALAFWIVVRRRP